MASAATFPPAFEIVQLSGPGPYGGLFGVLTVQLYSYYQGFPHDKPLTKYLVYAVYCIQLVDITLSTRDAFTRFGSGFGDVSVLTKIHFTWLTSPIITALESLIVQSFYAFRLHMFSESRIIPALIVTASVAVSVVGCVTGGFALEAGDLTKLNTRKISIPAGVWLVGSALIDIIIAACMTYTASPPFASLMALTTVILFFGFPGKGYYTTAATIMPMVYANTMLAVLNARSRIGGRSPAAFPSSINLVSVPEHLRDTRGSIAHTAPIVSINRGAFSDGEMDAAIEMKARGDSSGRAGAKP
ncbi:hypothetical protein B0H14DRAFT_3867428 [Mycena olivaceomarginata]|nr:hypothetical protein B0H14DRAFT_3867428 [Mycena olivaceomarginata]